MIKSFWDLAYENNLMLNSYHYQLTDYCSDGILAHDYKLHRKNNKLNRKRTYLQAFETVADTKKEDQYHD